MDLDGVVHPITVEIVERATAQAGAEGYSAVLLKINTPGGLLDATRQTIERIVASPVPVITYVYPSGGRAASAGFFLLQAGDIAAMAPGTNTGAAHPVLVGREMDEIMKQKAESDAAASIRSMAAKRGRNDKLAELAVRESKSFTEQEALAERLIELVAQDPQDLLAQLHGREITRFDGRKETLDLEGATLTAYELNLRQRFLRAISDPNIALVLLVLGVLGVYVEFSTPGLIFPGVAGAILALLALSAISVLPISWTGVALLLLAITLFILETQVASHGILGIGGAVAMVLGSVLLIDSPIPEMRIRWSVALAVGVPFAAITVFLVTLVVRARANKVMTGAPGMLDANGIAVTELNPRGRILVLGEYWHAVSDPPAAAGARVRVVGVRGLELDVRPEPGQDPIH